MMMRIGYVLKRFPRLTETFILTELLELERQGVEVEVIALKRPKVEAQHDLLRQLRAPVTYLPGGASALAVKMKSSDGAEHSLLEFINGVTAAANPVFADNDAETICTRHIQAAALAVLAQERSLDHLHAHFGTDATTVAMMAAAMSGLKFSMTTHAKDIFHNYIDPATDRAMRRTKMQAADFVVTVSDYNLKYLKTLNSDLRHCHIHRIYNGLDLRGLTATTQGREISHILSIGRLIEKKGTSDLIDALGRLAAGGREFTCDIVGEGPLHDRLQAQIQSLGLQDRVSLIGSLQQDDVHALMRRATIFVLPCIIGSSGDRDGLPTVLLEAMALGLPCISSDIVGIPEMIEHGASGYLAPQADPEALCGAMRKLLDDPALRDDMAAAARKTMLETFDVRQSVSELIGFFEQSVGARRARREAVQ